MRPGEEESEFGARCSDDFPDFRLSAGNLAHLAGMAVSDGPRSASIYRSVHHPGAVVSTSLGQTRCPRCRFGGGSRWIRFDWCTFALRLGKRSKIEEAEMTRRRLFVIAGWILFLPLAWALLQLPASSGGLSADQWGR